MAKLKNIEIEIDLNNIKFDQKNAKKVIRKLRNLRKKADFLGRGLTIKTLNKDIEDVHKIHNQYEYYICVAIKTVQIENKKDRYNYLYDEICYYLDHACSENNLCDFKNDKCFVKRNTDVTMGCCHHFPDKRFGMLYQKELIQCEYLGEKGCTTKSIGCKMFMCDEIIKKGYKFTVYNVLPIRYFFNFIQKIIIKTSVFHTKEETMKRLIKFDY